MLRALSRRRCCVASFSCLAIVLAICVALSCTSERRELASVGLKSGTEEQLYYWKDSAFERKIIAGTTKENLDVIVMLEYKGLGFWKATDVRSCQDSQFGVATILTGSPSKGIKYDTASGLYVPFLTQDFYYGKNACVPLTPERICPLLPNGTAVEIYQGGSEFFIRLIASDYNYIDGFNLARVLSEHGMITKK